MALTHSPSIVRDGLVLHLDAANVKSYPGSGSTWTDLSGNGYQGELLNGPTFDGTSIYFDSLDDGARFITGINFSGTDDITISGWINVDVGGFYWRWFSGASGGSYHYPDLAILAGGQIGFVHSNLTTGWQIAGSIELNKWVNLTYIFKNTGEVIIYKNDENIYSNTFTSGTFLSNFNFVLGNRYDLNSEAIQGSISDTKIYNRALTEEEIKQNFEALRGRYGI